MTVNITSVGSTFTFSLGAALLGGGSNGRDTFTFRIQVLQSFVKGILLQIFPMKNLNVHPFPVHLQFIFPKWRCGGSKAVWRISENWSNVVKCWKSSPGSWGADCQGVKAGGRWQCVVSGEYGDGLFHIQRKKLEKLKWEGGDGLSGCSGRTRSQWLWWKKKEEEEELPQERWKGGKIFTLGSWIVPSNLKKICSCPMAWLWLWCWCWCWWYWLQVKAEEGLMLSSSHGLVTDPTWKCRPDHGSNFLPPIRLLFTCF